ncbi:hypothetical protein LEP1GSC034_3397 [Leptospira interrogans str. 2003000735]|nr:hypothetical protein LEP1GSC026_0124 [Leptospira interrogans str. 2002000623]EMJ66244.1 hypothetical protein LEP1GSC034_3397 [Leptospira interrogans str. 2003000735]EMJ70089.1 hypothetical protein LEP1GSC033_0847 [Leptospira interrogans str. 2002000632]EMJ77191.1 hypothetical protein LEP1GSC032_2776 [Leptospira interrogans str. 2002000631]
MSVFAVKNKELIKSSFEKLILNWFPFDGNDRLKRFVNFPLWNFFNNSNENFYYDDI